MTRHRLAITVALLALIAAPAAARQTTGAAGARGADVKPPVTFNDKDRKITIDWYEAHRTNPPAGLTDKDQPSPAAEQKLKQGVVLDQTLQDLIRPVPTDLLHMLAPPPGVYRYAIVNWHLVLIDDSYRVADVIHIGHPR